MSKLAKVGMADTDLRTSTESTAGAPPSFICPITHGIMHDPVMDPDGISYERTAIEAWLTKTPTSPETRKPLTINDLVPNRALKEIIDLWQKNKSPDFHYVPPAEKPVETVVLESAPPPVVINVDRKPHKEKKHKPKKHRDCKCRCKCRGCCYPCCKCFCPCFDVRSDGGKARLIVFLVILMILGGWAVVSAVVLVAFVLFIATCGFCYLCCGLCVQEECWEGVAECCCCCFLCDDV